MTQAAAPFRLGVVADDVTGACDLAGRVAETGVPTVVTVGVPSGVADLFPPSGPGCAVVALKSRTAPAADAASASAASARALLAAGATLLYQKYCSTFDSTDRGNIGQVADALADAAGAADAGAADAGAADAGAADAGADAAGADAVVIGTPSTPGSGRTQRGGILFVDGVPLAETSMRDHPLTPMRDSDLPRLLRAQTPRPVALVAHPVVDGGVDAVASALRSLADGGARHLLTDAVSEPDLDTIARAVLALAAERPVVAGGAAGLATALARAAAASAPDAEPAAGDARVPRGRRLIVSGSASAATRAQNDAFDGVRIVVDPSAIAADPPGETARLAARLAAALRGTDARQPVLLTATATAADVARAQAELGAGRAAHLIETCLADLAAHAVESLGVTGLFVAGGETSGAVVGRLGVRRLRVGAQVAPGVAWTSGDATRAGGRRVALLLKSGNFGGPDLFATAWEAIP